ncbi:MAG: nitrophenyl compound nitroreductase subunit ArsF family protein [Candidatus Zixiibacteriota bacterium]
MKGKKILTIILAVFIIASVAHVVYHNFIKDADAEIVSVDAAPAFSGVTVYYFHNTKRCPTCTKIEELSYKTVHDNFADALASGAMQWQVINIEEPPNEHYADDYGLIVQSLVVVDNRPGHDGNWKNLEQIWDLVWEEDQFTDYVKSEIDSVMVRN